ncbi:MAG: CoA transferase, partial [Myxococcota bacterium]|nr:CoA transferase [Myxococcota bacterium]
LMAELQAAGVEAGVVRDFAGLQDDPQLRARGHFVPLDHASLGRLAFERSGARLSATPGRIGRPGPHLGEHSQAILSGILGLSDAEIHALVEAEVNL